MSPVHNRLSIVRFSNRENWVWTWTWLVVQGPVQQICGPEPHSEVCVQGLVNLDLRFQTSNLIVNLTDHWHVWRLGDLRCMVATQSPNHLPSIIILFSLLSPIPLSPTGFKPLVRDAHTSLQYSLVAWCWQSSCHHHLGPCFTWWLDPLTAGAVAMASPYRLLVSNTTLPISAIITPLLSHCSFPLCAHHPTCHIMLCSFIPCPTVGSCQQTSVSIACHGSLAVYSTILCHLQDPRELLREGGCQPLHGSLLTFIVAGLMHWIAMEGNRMRGHGALSPVNGDCRLTFYRPKLYVNRCMLSYPPPPDYGNMPPPSSAPISMAIWCTRSSAIGQPIAKLPASLWQLEVNSVYIQIPQVSTNIFDFTWLNQGPDLNWTRWMQTVRFRSGFEDYLDQTLRSKFRFWSKVAKPETDRTVDSLVHNAHHHWQHLAVSFPCISPPSTALGYVSLAYQCPSTSFPCMTLLLIKLSDFSPAHQCPPRLSTPFPRTSPPLSDIFLANQCPLWPSNFFLCTSLLSLVLS